MAVNTQPHRERIALENLDRQSFEAYCPMIQRRIRHARRTMDVSRPLFPGYLFVRTNPDLQRWRPILSTYGVRRIIGCGERLSFIEDGLIAGLKAREVDGVIVRPVEPYRLGQQVRMRGGPLDGLVATIIEMDEKDRLVVLMDLLNQSVKVKVATTSIHPA
ncbi:MAG: transcriptional activator RfaH [Hyphomicrobiaceae bacterium]|nr:transcriptional activator RfaH [Hyphomicrobiaceae bacterium]